MTTNSHQRSKQWKDIVTKGGSMSKTSHIHRITKTKCNHFFCKLKTTSTHPKQQS